MTAVTQVGKQVDRLIDGSMDTQIVGQQKLGDLVARRLDVRMDRQADRSINV